MTNDAIFLIGMNLLSLLHFLSPWMQELYILHCRIGGGSRLLNMGALRASKLVGDLFFFFFLLLDPELEMDHFLHIKSISQGEEELQKKKIYFQRETRNSSNL